MTEGKLFESFKKDEIVIFKKNGVKKKFVQIIKKYDIETSNFYKSEKYTLEDFETDEKIEIEIKNDHFRDGISFEKIWLQTEHFDKLKNKIRPNKTDLKILFNDHDNMFIINDGLSGYCFFENDLFKKKLTYLCDLFEVLKKYEIYYEPINIACVKTALF